LEFHGTYTDGCWGESQRASYHRQRQRHSQCHAELTDTGTGETYYSRSVFFGNYRFADIPTGQSYILTARAKRFTFIFNTQVITLLEDLANVNFVGTTQF